MKITREYLLDKDRRDTIASIRRGIADTRAGRVTEAETFFEEFEEKYDIPGDL